jgi:hypothetical protein
MLCQLKGLCSLPFVGFSVLKLRSENIFCFCAF